MYSSKASQTAKRKFGEHRRVQTLPNKVRSCHREVQTIPCFEYGGQDLLAGESDGTTLDVLPELDFPKAQFLESKGYVHPDWRPFNPSLVEGSLVQNVGVGVRPVLFFFVEHKET